MKSASNEHVYELKKMRMSQDKDGFNVVLRLHPEDFDTPLVRDPVGSVFEGPLTAKNYHDVT